MKHHRSNHILFTAGTVLLNAWLAAVVTPGGAAEAVKLEPATPAQNKACADCHRKNSPALVMEWERSKHAKNQVGCLDCHGA